jgi:hypothetical protein
VEDWEFPLEEEEEVVVVDVGERVDEEMIDEYLGNSCCPG